ncbi:MAG: GAF domain-containing protein [Acidobacteriota bacterium]
MPRWSQLALPVASAGLVLLVAALLQPITDRAWAPLMVPAVAICAWYGRWPAGLGVVVLGAAGRIAVISPPPWDRPLWMGLWSGALLVTIVLVDRLRQARDDRVESAHIARERADRAARAVAARRAAFLAHASEVLASSPDYETTLAAVANLAVPQIADLCVVDIVQDDGSFRALAVAHVDPLKVQLVHELRGLHPLDPKAPFGPPRVLRTGHSLVYSLVDQHDSGDGPEVDPAELRVATALGIRSSMAVPLLVGGRRLGVISFATTDSGRRFVAADLEFAEDLARRAAIAIDAARP